MEFNDADLYVVERTASGDYYGTDLDVLFISTDLGQAVGFYLAHELYPSEAIELCAFRNGNAQDPENFKQIARKSRGYK